SAAVLKVLLGGGAPIPLAVGQDQTYDVAVDSNHVYWGNYGIVSSQVGSVWQADKDGGNATPLASGQNGLYSIAIDGVNVYWTEPGAGMVMKAPMDSDGGSAVPLAMGQNVPYGIATDGAFVYWVNEIG